MHFKWTHTPRQQQNVCYCLCFTPCISPVVCWKYFGNELFWLLSNWMIGLFMPGLYSAGFCVETGNSGLCWLFLKFCMSWVQEGLQVLNVVMGVAHKSPHHCCFESVSGKHRWLYPLGQGKDGSDHLWCPYTAKSKRRTWILSLQAIVYVLGLVLPTPKGCRVVLYMLFERGESCYKKPFLLKHLNMKLHCLTGSG